MRAVPGKKAETTMEPDKGQSRFAVELRIIPIWAWVIAGIVLLCAQFFFNFAILHHPHPGHLPPPAWARPILGLLAGGMGGCWILLIGWICGDARRRGMSALLWGLVALCVPYGMGILLYFILRQTRHASCPQCGYGVQAGFNFCPQCSYKLGLNCPQCQKVVGMNDVYCPYCGTALRTQTNPAVPTS